MAVETRVPDEDCEAISGWGRTAPTLARVHRPRGHAEAVEAVLAPGRRGVVARGLGRACGDAAQNAGGTVLDMSGFDRILAVDTSAGLVVCEAGVTLHRLMEALVPFGWFVPVAPGTRYMTVGGAIGADVHGGNHPVSGSFGRHVTALELLTADGQIRTVPPGTPLFDATTGGLGLTGVILSATLRLLPVETSLMRVDTERVPDLDALMARLADGGRRYRYSAARIDLLARGAATGRAVLTRGDHVPYDALPRRHRARRTPLDFRPGRLPAPPPYVPGGLLGRTSVGLLNELWYRGAPRAATGRLQSLPAFFHPLDGVPHRNRIHGPEGFVRYRFVVPYGQEDALRRIVRRIADRGLPSFPAVLKRFGAGDPGPLSFPLPGWALALGLPTGLPGLGHFLDALDEEVAGVGGRVDLADDSRVRPEALAAMYPRLDEFRALRAALDPRSVFTSDLARRLGL
ncbi:FAD-binding oxidoreductase [Streptomyces sp. TLI_105]|uniref:FAD-binding oxidoreductase n=1 Tax=Streptomyces sp. TLI_105 TaxID=1881019 RepID=UPI00089BE608|nr:FAD-binding oxidoreductase [Streptomyces sp. TLI_105]SEC66784.1 decaprenylphospho-beta-D-ribofuranose 2-oxidase [Streptomyces sp. TLI_105]